MMSPLRFRHFHKHLAVEWRVQVEGIIASFVLAAGVRSYTRGWNLKSPNFPIGMRIESWNEGKHYIAI